MATVVRWETPAKNTEAIERLKQLMEQHYKKPFTIDSLRTVGPHQYGFLSPLQTGLVLFFTSEQLRKCFLVNVLTVINSLCHIIVII